MRCGALTAQAEETLRQYALEPERLTGANLGRYEKGEPLCMEGGPIEHLLILLEGRAKVSITTEEGNSLLTCFYHGGGVVGDLELLTGQKTAGTNVIVQVPIRCIRIPMRAEARSLNLSNSVAIVAYEALRQQGFPELAGEGEMAGER